MIDLIVAAATSEPSQGGYPDPEQVTPGTIGFVATFLFATAFVLLARNLLKRQRAMRARAGVVRHHPIPVERTPRTGPQNVGMSTGVEVESAPLDGTEPHPESDAPRNW